MNIFLGHSEARLDEKGRLFIPAGYRKIIREFDSQRLVVRKDDELDCLIFFPEHKFTEKALRLQENLEDWDSQDNAIIQNFLYDSEILEMDGQGRVLLNKQKLQSISVEQDGVFIGMFDRFALWNPELFERSRMDKTDMSLLLKEKMRGKKA